MKMMNSNFSIHKQSVIKTQPCTFALSMAVFVLYNSRVVIVTRFVWPKNIYFLASYRKTC